MDLLQQFNHELQSIQPPISKQKMMKITKLAIKNVKLYKHIVQSVEKYISKCPNSLKLSSLYVIDAIVRQSIYRLKDKDVYAARFARNFSQTFQYIFHSVPTNDKPKIVRVLNLWQRNGVFSAETIQPLLDLPNKSNAAPVEPQTMFADSPQTPLNQNLNDDSNMLLIQQIANTLALVKGANQIGDNQRNNYDHHNRSNNNNISSQGVGTSGQARFTKRLMDYDYDDTEGPNGDETPTEAEPPLSTTLSKIEMEHRSKNEYSGNKSDATQHQNQISNAAQNILSMPAILERWQKLQAQHLIVDDQAQNRLDSVEEKPSENVKDARASRGYEKSSSQYDSHERSRRTRSRSISPSPANRHKSRYPNRDNDSRSRSGSPTNKRSRSHRSRSRSHSRAEGRACIDVKDHNEDRHRRGLPEMRKNCLTICSTTLWLGHVPKTVSEADISDAFGEFGTITSIDLIPPRGCAYVCMDRRQDAYKALNDLRNLRLSGSLIKMAWAPGKGLKDKEFKDYWEVHLGASFIPYSKLRSDLDIDTLEEGGVIDEDTMTEELKKMKTQKERDREEKARIASDQLASLLPVIPPIAALSIPNQPPPPFPIPPNLSVPPPSLNNIPLPSLHRGLVLGENLNEKGDRDSRISEHSSYTENSLSPLKDGGVSIPLPPMSIPPPPIFTHGPPPFGLPPPPIPSQSGVPSLPIFQNPPPPVAQISGLSFTAQTKQVEDAGNENSNDDQQECEKILHQQAEFDEEEDRPSQSDESFQHSNHHDQQHPQNHNQQHPQNHNQLSPAMHLHPHMGFQTNATMIPQDDSFNYQMMAGPRPMLHQNMVIHQQQQQQQPPPQPQQNFCDYDQHGPPSQGRLLPVSDESNMQHEFMANQTNALYDFNCNPVVGGPQQGYGGIPFGFDDFGYSGPPNGVNRWNGPPRPTGFVPRHVQRGRFRNNGRGRERQR